MTHLSQFYAIVRKSKNSDYGIEFPDLPGCISAGSTLSEAADMAEEALAGHVATMIEYGDEVPAPSSLNEIEKWLSSRKNRGTDYHGILSVYLAEEPEEIEPVVRLNISMNSRVLKQLDRRVHRDGVSRSALLAQLIRSYC